MANKIKKTSKPKLPEKNLEKTIKKIMSFLDAEAEVKKEGGTYAVNISSSDSGRLIGRFGQTLTELQHLIRMVANQMVGERVSLVVDVENYKANKNRELEELALSVADNVQKSGYPQTLRSMNAYERRVIHAALTDFPGVETLSVGEEPNRCIEIKPKKS